MQCIPRTRARPEDKLCVEKVQLVRKTLDQPGDPAEEASRAHRLDDFLHRSIRILRLDYESSVRAEAEESTNTNATNNLAQAPQALEPDPSSDSTSSASTNPDDDGLESWVDWMRRVTAEVELERERCGIKGWETQQRMRKCRCAGHVARMLDGRWAKVLLLWQLTESPSATHPWTPTRALVR